MSVVYPLVTLIRVKIIRVSPIIEYVIYTCLQEMQ